MKLTSKSGSEVKFSETLFRLLNSVIWISESQILIISIQGWSAALHSSLRFSCGLRENLIVQPLESDCKWVSDPNYTSEVVAERFNNCKVSWCCCDKSMNPSPVQNLWLDLTNANEGRTHSNLLFGACGILPEIFDPGGINVMMPSASTENLRK